MATLPGTFPEDEPDVSQTVPNAKRTMPELSKKGQMELERKRKVVEKQKEFAEKWESWKGYTGEANWSQTVYKPETGAQTWKENPRVPPGNHISRQFRVMDLDFMPEMDMTDYALSVTSKLGTVNLTLDDIRSLGEEEYVKDFHCVTKWSHLDVKWTGVKFSKVLERCRSVVPENWRFMLESSADGYTTNIPRREIERDDVYLVYGLEGQIPIPLEHGAIRIVKPHLYMWKSAKWLERIDLVEEDQPGFWEVRGFHMRGNCWAEERYGTPTDKLEELPAEFEKSP